MEARWLLLKKEMAPDGKQYYPGKNASKPSEGLFERYVQLPHLLAEAMERLENVAERLQVNLFVKRSYDLFPLHFCMVLEVPSPLT